MLSDFTGYLFIVVVFEIIYGKLADKLHDKRLCLSWSFLLTLLYGRYVQLDEANLKWIKIDSLRETVLECVFFRRREESGKMEDGRWKMEEYKI